MIRNKIKKVATSINKVKRMFKDLHICLKEDFYRVYLCNYLSYNKTMSD